MTDLAGATTARAAGPGAHARILILDFGAQYTQLIARRLRETHVYCEIHPYDVGDVFVRSFAPNGVILSGGFAGDRADIRWASGHRALEVARRLDTQSPDDVALKSGVFMRVAAFDHKQIRHTRHVRPIRLEVE